MVNLSFGPPFSKMEPNRFGQKIYCRAEGAFRPLPRARARAREIEDPASGIRIRKLFRTTFAVVFEFE